MARNERVTKVIDGDTFKTNMRKNSIRLSGVNAPEMKNKGGSAAKNELQKLIGNKTVNIQPVARDKYGRTVAKVKIGTRSVNNAMNKKLSDRTYRGL